MLVYIGTKFKKLLQMRNCFFNEVPWYVDIVNFLSKGIMHDKLTVQERKMLLHLCRFNHWDVPYLFRLGQDGLLRRCIPKEEQTGILQQCHDTESGVHFGGKRIVLRCCNVASFGQQFSRMHTTIARVMINVRELGL